LNINKILSKFNKKILQFDKECDMLVETMRPVVSKSCYLGGYYMWTERQSLVLSKCFVIWFMAILASCAVYAPWAINGRYFVLAQAERAYFLATVYTGVIPAAVLLVLLLNLLRRISAGKVFVKENTDCLRHISWCCFAGAAIGIASAFYWFPWLAVGIAAGFMGLIVRVVKNVVAEAVSLQDDADYTI